jgi:hypothetical protein
MAQSKFDAILDRKRTGGDAFSQDREQRKRGRPAGKRSNPEYAQVTAYIPRALHDEVKILLIREGGREFSELVTELLSEWMQKRETTSVKAR